MDSEQTPLWLPRPLTPEEEAYAARLVEAADGKTVVLNAKVEIGGRIVSERPWFIGCMFVPPTEATPPEIEHSLGMYAPETPDERQAGLAKEVFERVWHSAHLMEVPANLPTGVYAGGCANCPFSSGGDDANPSDPDEGHYDCALTGLKNIWGESPRCTPEQWKAKASEYLATIADERPLYPDPGEPNPEIEKELLRQTYFKAGGDERQAAIVAYLRKSAFHAVHEKADAIESGEWRRL